MADSIEMPFGVVVGWTSSGGACAGFHGATHAGPHAVELFRRSHRVTGLESIIGGRRNVISLPGAPTDVTAGYYTLEMSRDIDSMRRYRYR